MGRFCEIQTRNELADYLGVPRSKLTYMLYVVGTKNCYRTFQIPKKYGGEREICAPNSDLKDIQRRLAGALCEFQRIHRSEKGIYSNISHAFEAGKGIITNAAIHRNKRFVLNLDLKDFFPSFHFGRVKGYFEKNRDFHLPSEVALTIAQIACYKGHLPQGAPSSPVISNLICQILDMRLLKIARQNRLNYTRYADDLTFSTNDRSFLERYDVFLKDVAREIEKAGFSINEKKTRLQYQDSRQEVTGLVVNKKIHVPREFYKETRAMAHRLYTQGEFEICGEPATIEQLEGRFAFIDQLEHYNNKIDSGKHSCNTLHTREKQYQAFLFYKYFFANDRPLIITEGKTDSRYIKAALKHFCPDYPHLVSQDDEGNFHFLVSFFRRSDRWKYFFGMSTDGADAMKSLFRYFVPDLNSPDYSRTFFELCGSEPRNPVIFLYDNETVSDRPLKEFLRYIKLDKERRTTLQNDLSIPLVEESKLYLLTIPLIGGKNECEIEDLLAQETLDIELDGKHFSREDSYDKSKFYGKDTFSKYIYRNYQTIDFSNFRPLLDALNNLI